MLWRIVECYGAEYPFINKSKAAKLLCWNLSKNLNNGCTEHKNMEEVNGPVYTHYSQYCHRNWLSGPLRVTLLPRVTWSQVTVSRRRKLWSRNCKLPELLKTMTASQPWQEQRIIFSENELSPSVPGTRILPFTVWGLHFNLFYQFSK